MPTLNDIKVQAYELLNAQAIERGELLDQQAIARDALDQQHRAALLAGVQQAIGFGLTYEQVPLAFKIILGNDLLELFE